jgi:hypothetical protein
LKNLCAHINNVSEYSESDVEPSDDDMFVQSLHLYDASNSKVCMNDN